MVCSYNIKDKSATNFLATTLIIGLIFTFSQGWKDLVVRGVYLTGEGSNPSGSFIYVITLAHLIHLLGGIVALGITTVNQTKYILKEKLFRNRTHLNLLAFYWVVVVISIFIF